MKGIFLGTGIVIAFVACAAQEQERRSTQRDQRVLPDAVQEAQTPRQVARTRPEQQKTERDDPKRFAGTNAPSLSPAFKDQPEEGKIKGFDFARDPLNAKTPIFTTFEDIMKADEAAKPGVMAKQRELLESRYNLTPKLDDSVKMSRGKPIAVGPTAKLKNGTT